MVITAWIKDESDPECRARLRELLSADPSTFGRLFAVSALRSRSDNLYRHPLAETYGAGEVDMALARLHREIFESWLNLKLEEQERDLSGWLWRTQGDDKSSARLRGIAHELGRLIPAQHSEVERVLFESDFQVLMALL